MSSYFIVLGFAIAAMTGLSLMASTGSPAHDAIADTLVNQSLQVRPGEAIQIAGIRV